ncbi:hypothetical protein MML48_3g00021529 [Holotrichia oblita]|uniref:Uncharacterized protein n=1 Tax=Holotrichia oblita TaxID=644536 RepID=A0ACB9TH27_HOLOL|nr:hypothetical protein MML48_3g00021529 [Holotrichia oblita]
MTFTEYIAELSNNPYFGAGFGLFGLGAGAAILLKGFQTSLILFRRHYMITLEVPCRDKSYQWLLHWMTQKGAKQTQHLSVETSFEQKDTGYVKTKYDFIPSVGTHFFRNQSQKWTPLDCRVLAHKTKEFWNNFIRSYTPLHTEKAMDQLLLACYAQQLNLFVESFLKMVQKLLESTEPQLQILATLSFVKFANIEEDTPSYHRRYDFFVSKFSAMCHGGAASEIRNKIRIAGIQGLQAVVRKTVSDDLVENIWESVHMDKIVPSLLFNMQESTFHTNESGEAEPVPEEQFYDPPMLAETCMRELVIVETLMAHLDENSKSSPTIRTSIVDVLSKIIAIAAGESVGPSVLEIINSLLSHLRDSVKHGNSQMEEKMYRDALINALGEFANHLPDYQKIEIMMFIMNKIPFPLNENRSPADNLLQSMLLKSLLKVGTKYQTIHLNTTFPVSFLEPLLRMSLAPDPDMRLLVQKILHTLIDRHNNLEKLTKPYVKVSELSLTLEKSSRPDLIFINKHGPIIYDALYTSLQMDSNTVRNIEAVYTTLALLCVELSSAETAIDLLQFILGIQSLSLNSTVLSNAQKFNLHAIVISLLTLVPLVVTIQPLLDYAEKLSSARKREAPHLLPDLQEQYPANCELANKLPHLLVDQMALCEYVKNGGLDPARLAQTSPYGAGGPCVVVGNPRRSWVEMGARGSIVEISNVAEVDSVSSSPGVQRKLPEEELTFESMKKVLTEPPESRKEIEAERREQISHTFRTAPFSELVRKTQPKHDALRTKLNEIFKSLSMNEAGEVLRIKNLTFQFTSRTSPNYSCIRI